MRSIRSRPIRPVGVNSAGGRRRARPCAGGDIRALWESSKVKGDLGKSCGARITFSCPDQQIPKALCRLHGRHRDGRWRRPVRAQPPSRRHRTHKTRDAEVGLGFFPDVGGTWLLSHSPGEIGTYFGLTGQTMNGPDAVYAGFADAVVPSAKLAALREALTKVAAGEAARSKA
jgi:enoyl-CoA hydratase